MLIAVASIATCVYALLQEPAVALPNAVEASVYV